MMIITNEHRQRVLIPSDSKWLLAVEELEFPVGERNYTQAVYIANVLTLEDCARLYVEADKLEEIEEPKGEENA